MIFTDYPNNPLIRPPFPSPIIADPSVLTPNESPDRLWHLFAHSIFGLHHYTSPDGISWNHTRFLFPLSIRPYVYKENETFYLLYEKLTNILKFPHYDSHLELRSSTNLVTWSKPIIIPIPGSEKNTGNPCLIKHKNTYYLFCSTGLVYLPDCHFCEPKSMVVTTSKYILGPFKLRHITSKGVTANRICKTVNGFLGLQTTFYLDASTGHTRSRIRLVRSKNLLNWTVLSDSIIKPDQPWKKSFVYVGNLKQYANQFRIYYNARNGWLFGTESIGLSLA